MKLSNNTIEVLKNFSAINSNIAFGTESKVLRTVAISKNLMAKSNVEEDFPYKFGVYDLPQFLSCLGMFENPDLEFDDSQKFALISDGNSTIKYYFSDIENLVTTDKDLNMPNIDVTFTITDSQLGAIRKASGALSGDNLVITKKDDGNIKLTVTDIDDPTSNEYSLDITDCNIDTEATFEFIFNIGNFKFNTADKYVFGISSKMISSVVAGDTNYWVALDKNSKYGV